MKAIIMAAGKGTRISRFIQDKPKCTIKLKHTTLIEYTVSILKKKGIPDISVVLGYESDCVRAILRKTDVKFYYNPFFDITNSVSSLWFAREELGKDDTLIMNGDVFFEERFLDIFLNEKRSPVLFSDESRKEIADYKLYYEKGLLKKYGKNLTGRHITGEYVGVAKISKDNSVRFRKKMEEAISAQRHGLWWEDVLYEMSDRTKIYVKNIAGLFWAEVDYVEDYERIQQWVKAHNI